MTLRLGVDVGGTLIRLRMYPGEATRLEVPTTASGGPSLVERIGSLIESFTAESPRPDRIGVGIAGIVDTAAGTVRHAVNLGVDGTPFPLAAKLSSRLAIPVVIENDVRAAALGSYHHLLATNPGLSHLVYLSLGTGISAGVVLDGQLHRGSRGIAGEIGHAPLGDPTMTCTCGLRGCLEAVAGGRVLDDRIDGGARSLFDELRLHPGETERVVAAVARAVHVLTTVFDPDLFVLGGGIARDAAPEVRDALAGMASVSPFGEAVLDPDRVVTLPPDADVGTAGAAMLGSRLSVGDPQTSSAHAAEGRGGTK